jgi:ankyrin repeat protein
MSSLSAEEEKAAAAYAAAAFVDSAACGDTDEIKKLLSAATIPPLSAATINALDKDGRSAFHYSCLNDDAPLLKILLAEPRVDVTLVAPRGETGLHMAALYCAQEALKLLFADGRCSLNAKNNFGETPMHLCASSGDKGAVKAARLLLEYGASMTETDKWGRGPINVR